MLKQLKAKLAALQARRKELKAKIDSGEELSGEEQTEYLANVEEAKTVLAQVKTLEAETELDAFEASGEQVPDSIATPEIIPGGIKNGLRSAGEFFQAVIAASIKDHDDERIGRFPCGRVSEDLLKAQREFRAAASGLNESTPAEGGFLVGTDYGTQLLDGAFEQATLPQLCTPISISANSNKVSLPAIDETSRATGSRFGGIQVYMAHEADSVTAKKPKFRRIDLELKKMMGLTYLTDELMQDEAALESWVRRMFTAEMGFKMDDLIIRGTGAGEPLGILNSPALRTIAKEAAQEADTILYENIIKAFTFNNGVNPIWLTNRECLPQLMVMSIPVANGGIPVWQPAGGAANRPNDTILGRPAYYKEQASALGDVGDVIFADFSQYLFASKGDIQTARSIHVNFLSGETALRFTYRLDGQPIPNSKKSPYKGGAGNDYSPFVALGAR